MEEVKPESSPATPTQKKGKGKQNPNQKKSPPAKPGNSPKSPVKPANPPKSPVAGGNQAKRPNTPNTQGEAQKKQKK